MWADCRVLEMTIHIIYMQHDRSRLCGCGLRIFSLSSLHVLLPFFCPSFLLFTFKTRWHIKKGRGWALSASSLVPRRSSRASSSESAEEETAQGKRGGGGARRGMGGFEDGEDGRIRGDEAQTGGEEAENILRTLRLRSEELQRGKRACVRSRCVSIHVESS